MNPQSELLPPPTRIGGVKIKNRIVLCALESTGTRMLLRYA